MKVSQLFEDVKLPKIKWKIAEAPSGKFRSFDKRGWPSAQYVQGDHAAIMIRSEDPYYPAEAKSGNHKPLTVHVADHSTRERKGPDAFGFEWRKLKGEFKTLAEAKKAGESFLQRTPQFWPKDLRPKEQE